MKNKLPLIVLYVADQAKSKSFFEFVLEQSPILDLPGMAEFKVSEHFILGWMPKRGIAKIICPTMPGPSTAYGIPR